MDILRRSFSRFRADNATDLAAALTYYGIQSIFPALLVLMSVVGLAGRSATNTLIHNIRDVAPGPAEEIITNAIKNLQGHGGAASVGLVIGVLAALWSASGYVGAYTRAANTLWKVEEGRPFLKLRPMQLGITAAMLILLSVSAIAVVLTGDLAKHAGDIIGVGSSAVTVWDIAKWPVLVLMVSVMLSLLYWAAPFGEQRPFRFFTMGSVVAVVAWVVISGLFALYVANFASYNKTYGTLGGVIAFLVWLWITNVAVLFGTVVNAEVAKEEGAAPKPAKQRPVTLHAATKPPQAAR